MTADQPTDPDRESVPPPGGPAPDEGTNTSADPQQARLPDGHATRLVRLAQGRSRVAAGVGCVAVALLAALVLVLQGGSAAASATPQYACFTTDSGQALCGQAAASFCMPYVPTNGSPAEEFDWNETLRCLAFTDAENELADITKWGSDPDLKPDIAFARTSLQHAEQQGIYVQGSE